MSPEQFVAESNHIEGIERKPTKAEVNEFNRFMALGHISIAELVRFVSVYQPNAVLRDRVGLDVRVAAYRPPAGSPEIRHRLGEILSSLDDYSAYENHLRYEKLHPFTDGNGRSGRMLWAWEIGIHAALSLGFLHRFYYQTLSL